VIACVLVVYGVYNAYNAPWTSSPISFSPGDHPDRSPRAVAREGRSLVTVPVESAVQGVMNIESVRSQSIQGLAIVTVVFKEGTDILVARQLLTEQLSAVVEVCRTGSSSPAHPLTSATWTC